jgi:hypothetical protein
MIGAITAGLFSTGAAAGGGTAYESIATVNVGVLGSSTISFTSIPSGFKHLQVRAIMRSTFADTDSFLKLNLNSDTGSNYPNHFLNGNGSTAGAFGYSTSQYAFAFLSMYPASLASASLFGNAVVDILDYQNTNKNKTIRSLGGYDVNGSGVVRLNSAAWLSTNAVTTIDITDFRGGNFAQYSSFALYGIKG